jgi:hypothetical protein
MNEYEIFFNHHDVTRGGVLGDVLFSPGGAMLDYVKATWSLANCKLGITFLIVHRTLHRI